MSGAKPPICIGRLPRASSMVCAKPPQMLSTAISASVLAAQFPFCNRCLVGLGGSCRRSNSQAARPRALCTARATAGMITATLVVGLLAGAVYTQLFAIPSTAGSRSYRSPCPSPAPVLTTSNVSARDVNAAPRRHHERDPSAALNPRRAPDSGVAIGLGTDIAAPAFARREQLCSKATALVLLPP